MARSLEQLANIWLAVHDALPTDPKLALSAAELAKQSGLSLPLVNDTLRKMSKAIVNVSGSKRERRYSRIIPGAPAKSPSQS